jgi:hypothetical protein
VNATGATISTVEVSIQQVGGSCWTGSGDTYTATCPNYVAVTSGTTNWSLTVPNSDLTAGDSYSVTAQATDSYANVATSSTVTFTYAMTLPTVIITYPVHGSNVCACGYTGKITGTASSNSGSGTSITAVSVAIENTTTGKWWNGTSFSATSQTYVAASGTTSWTLALAGSSLSTGDTYSVVAKATDSLGNVGSSSPVSFTYCLKTSPPIVTITYPVNKTTYGTNWTGSITGTASAGAGATITKTSVAVENTETSKWWNGTSFGATAQSFVTASGTTSWSLPLARVNLTSGDTYSVIAKATDSLGYVGTSSTVSFTYCVNTAPPTVTITYPVDATTYGTNWTGKITGTASAGAGASISKTLLSIEDTTTKLWWNGSKFAASTQTYVPVTGTTTWMLTLSASLTSGNTYAVTAQATDNLGNTGTSATVTFTYSTPPPTVAITYPVNNTTYGTNWTGKITGTASSNSGPTTSISAVSVAVENTTTGKWWNGTSFTPGSQSFVAASGTTGWSLVLAASNLKSGDAYSVIAQATDSVGNVSASPTVNFTYNCSPPTVTITYPVTNTTYGTNWTGAITGTASAGAGASISKTSVAIENTTTGKWWNGTSFTPGSQSFVAASGTTGWSLVLAASNLKSGDAYSVIAQATDSVGNVSASPTVNFTYNCSPPTVTITYPVNKTTYGTNWTGAITGTASAGAGASISKTSVAIENTTTGKWWNGTSFSATAQTFVAASGTTSWSLGLLVKYLASGDSYSVTAQATDSLKNVGTSSTVTFSYGTCSHG